MAEWVYLYFAAGLCFAMYHWVEESAGVAEWVFVGLIWPLHVTRALARGAVRWWRR